MNYNTEVKHTAHDLGRIDKPWEGFVIRGELIYTPNGYYYPPGYIYSVPIRMQQIANYERELKTPQQMLL